MSSAIGLWEHFKRLADFRGCEDRASFWPYAALAFGIITVVGMVIFIPMMVDAMTSMQAYAQAHRDQVTVTQGPGEYSMSVHGNPPGIFQAGEMAAYLIVTFGLAIVLYSAAVTRRLHDRGLSGAWGLIPIPFIIYSSIQMPRMFATVGSGVQPDMNQFFSIFLSNMLYIFTLIALIVLLAGASKREPNRYQTVE